MFSIGVGFTSLDLTGLKLNQIMRGVERVEKKVDKLLKSGLKVAAIHYDSAVDKIMGKKYKDAFSKLDKVIDEATKAFVHIEDKEITIESYKECINSVILITFSTIMQNCYDDACGYCEAQARVRQGSARDGSQGERPQSSKPCQELTLKLVATHHHPNI